jgi:hypothetical protein
MGHEHGTESSQRGSNDSKKLIFMNLEGMLNIPNVPYM